MSRITDNLKDLALITSSGNLLTVNGELKSTVMTVSGSDLILDRTDSDFSVVQSAAANTLSKNVLFQKAGGGPIAGAWRFRGTVTKQDQPGFIAIGNSGRVTYGNGAQFILGNYTTNIGNCYSTSTGKFTAPIDGFYAIQYGVYSYTSGQLSLKKNGGDWTPSDAIGLCTIMNDSINSASLSIYLNKNDTVAFGWRTGSSGDIYTSHAWLSGFLVG